jgi:hypothetical protein
MPEFHAEPFVDLAGLSHTTAIIAWGAFYFRARSDGRAKLVDDEDLQWVHPPRCESIGCRSKRSSIVRGGRPTARSFKGR